MRLTSNTHKHTHATWHDNKAFYLSSLLLSYTQLNCCLNFLYVSSNWNCRHRCLLSMLCCGQHRKTHNLNHFFFVLMFFVWTIEVTKIQGILNKQHYEKVNPVCKLSYFNDWEREWYNLISIRLNQVKTVFGLKRMIIMVSVFCYGVFYFLLFL